MTPQNEVNTTGISEPEPRTDAVPVGSAGCSSSHPVSQRDSIPEPRPVSSDTTSESPRHALPDIKHASSSIRHSNSAGGAPKRPSHLVDIRDKKKSKVGVSMSKRDMAAMAYIGEIPTISAVDLQNAEWSRRLAVSVDETGVDGGSNSSNVAEPQGTDGSSHGQKKHQINWLAMDMKQKEGALLEKSVLGKQKQRSTAMKYGW